MIRSLALITALAGSAFGATAVINTAAVQSSGAGPFTIDFQFTAGNGAGNTNNTVTLSNFALGGGSLNATPALMAGGASVNASPLGITLTDSSFYNDLQFSFTPGTSLTFDYSYTSNTDSVAPDSFTVSIFDNTGKEMATTNPNGFNAFFELDLPTAASAATAITSISSAASLSGPTLTAPANGVTGVSLEPSLTWSEASGAISSDVYFGTSSPPPFVTNTTSTSNAPGALQPGTTYYWQVIARNASGEATSAIWSFTTGTTVSTTPAFSVSPGSGSIAHQVFTYTFTNSGGYQNLGVMDVLINNAINGIQACYVAYVPSSATSGSLFLVDNAGDAGGPYQGVVLPGIGTVQNSQCTINAAASSVTASGNTLTLTLDVTFSAAFAGNRITYMSAQGNGPGWQAMGTWDVPGGGTPVGPAVAGMSPARSSTSSQTYTFTFTDTADWQDIAVTDVLVNTAIDGRHGCYLAFVPSGASGGSVLLVDDAGDAGGPYAGLTLPGSGSVQNSQCTINAAGSSVTASGNTLTLNLAMSFSQSFGGNHIFFVAARNNTLNSNWQSIGSVSVP